MYTPRQRPGLLGAGNVAADNVSGSGSAKEITFTGTLVELPPGDPDSFETLQKAVLDTGIDSIKLGSDIVLSKRLQGTHPSLAHWPSTATGTR